MPDPLGPLAPVLDVIADRRARLRRGVLVRRRLVVALLVGGAVLAALHALSPPPPLRVGVTVAARDLPAGQVLAAEDLTVAGVPPAAVPDGLMAPGDLPGRVLAAPVRAGEAMTDRRVVQPGLLDGYPGLVAAPVRLPDDGAVGLLRVGDRVDVAATDPGTGAVALVARGARVLALPRDDGSVVGPAGRLVVLATTSGTAQNLASAGAARHLSVLISGS